ncbi:hypothetical protein [Dactylosporangium sp. CS-033363]|uniref:hypothetical protein n=1 Tax=Dactylosporangium sp. CS-033363 TaxID=3239935 RepID=UPI003D8EEAF2
MARFQLDPDPAWDLCEDRDGVLTVELSWLPDGLAARLTEIVASPALVAELTAAGLTGFSTAPAAGYFREDSFVEPGTAPPELVRLVPGADPGADFAYVERAGLTVSERALQILRAHCRRLEATEL